MTSAESTAHVKPLLSLDDVVMAYQVGSATSSGQDEHAVLKGVNLKLYAGERLGIVGRNGVGKSTLLRVMAKIFAPLGGVVTWSPGVSVSLLSLGLGFKDTLTGRENAQLAAMLQGFSRREARQQQSAIEAFCELGVYFDEPVKTYSNGMRARLGFATALQTDARVLLIDEVLSVGDAVFKEKARDALLGKFTQDHGVVIVSHSEAQLKQLCTRVAWINDGKVVADGAPDDVLAAYAHG